MSTDDNALSDWALELAERLLVDVPRRLAHTRAAVARATSIAPALRVDTQVLLASVALHDIGFSPDLGLDEPSTFPLYDAVRYLVSIGAPRRVTCLVAHHAGARYEAPLRGFGRQMEQFADESSLVSDGLWYSCLTVGPDGQDMSFDQRVEEWLERYADDPVMGPFTEIAEPELRAAAARVQAVIDATTRPSAH